MDPVQVLGDADTVLAFALGGIPGQVVTTADEVCAAVDAVVAAVHQAGGPVRRPALLLITHGAAAGVRVHLDRVMLEAQDPLILEIPGAADPPAQSPAERFVERVLRVRL